MSGTLGREKINQAAAPYLLAGRQLVVCRTLLCTQLCTVSCYHGEEKFRIDENSAVPAIRQIRPAIRQIRDKLGLTQEQMAELLDLKLYTYRRWEQGRHRPAPDQVMRLIKRLIAAVEPLQMSIQDLPDTLI